MAASVPPIKKLLSAFAAAAVSARVGGVDKSQVNRLIEVVMQSDPDTLLVHIARQKARREIDPLTAKHLVMAIDMLSRHVSSEEYKRELLRYLGYFKWFYESLERVRLTPQIVRDVQNVDVRNIDENFYRRLISEAIGAKIT